MSKLERKWGSILMVGAVCPIGVIDCDQLLEKASLFNVQSLPTNQSVVYIKKKKKPISCTNSKLRALTILKRKKGSPSFDWVRWPASQLTSLIANWLFFIFSGGWQNHKVITKQFLSNQSQCFDFYDPPFLDFLELIQPWNAKTHSFSL